MYSQEVVLMNTTGEFATFGATKPLKVIERTPQNLTHPSLNGSSAVDSALLPIGSNQPNMSIAFREVFKDYNSEMSENQNKSPLSLDGLHRKDKFSESFYVGDKLLTSNDNIRPKSRSKTVIAGYDIHKYSHLNGDSRTLHAKDYSLENSSKDHVKKSSSQHGVLSPVSVSNKEDKNDSNNAQEIPVNNKDVHTKGKRGRKRNNSPTKTKKGKHGRLLAAATSLQDKSHSFPSFHNSSSNQRLARISSEPPSKLSQHSSLSHTTSGSGHTHISNNPDTPIKQTQDVYSSRVTSAKNHTPSIQYMHGSSGVNVLSNSDNLQANGQSVMIYKLDFNARVKSAQSIKSDSTSNLPNGSATNTEELTLNAISCNVQPIQRHNKTVSKHHNKPHSHHSLSMESASKEAVLSSIYGAVYTTADKVSAQVEELKKVKKVFLSDKQSGTMKENGMEFPCAPPATPNPDVMKRHEYIPSMSDIRSQRAVKSRLQTLEKDAAKKQEKRKEANAKLEKQQSKEREKQLKIRQRREIYALNKIMTELENTRFLDFCQAKGLNKV